MTAFKFPFRWVMVGLLAGIAPLGGASAVAAIRNTWERVSPEERAGTKSTFEPDAPVEALVWRIDVNDDEFPSKRTTDVYVRYKIYDPEKADRVMRLAESIVSYNGYEYRGAEFAARLTLPDGTVRDFGPESVREREVVKKSTSDSFWGRLLSGEEGYLVKEKFLVVGGAVPGAVLEYHTVVTERVTRTTNYHSLQFEAIPTRQLTYHQKVARTDAGYVHNLFTVNPVNAELKEDKASRTVTLTAHDIPSLRPEPWSGSWLDRTMATIDCYVHDSYFSPKGKVPRSTRHFTPDEPWAAVATLENWLDGDHVEQTGKVKAKAEDLMQAPGTPLEKARRVHDFIAHLHQQFIHAPPAVSSSLTRAGFITSMDEVLKYAPEHPPWLVSADFLWLAVSLYRAAGFQAEILMVPDRSIVTFSPHRVSPAFLPGRCVALRIGDAWHFSFPHGRVPYGFDELPWEYEGLDGLLALDQKQQFIDVPLATAEQSAIRRAGTFSLDESGNLTGEGVITWRGHEGQILRSKLTGKTAEAQRVLVQSELAQGFDGAEVEVTEVRHVDAAYEPVEAIFKLTWTGFAVVTDGKMIFRPFIFRTRSNSPFSESERHSPIIFHFRRQEQEKFTIALPPGFVPEAKSAPPSFPGPALSYVTSLALDSKNMILHVARDFSTGLVIVSAKDYTPIKKWYDAVALCDQHNLVLRSNPGETPAPAKAPSTP